MKRRGAYERAPARKRGPGESLVVSARAVHAVAAGPKLSELPRGPRLWDAPPRGLERFSVHALKLFAPGVFDKDALPAEVLRMHEPRKLDFAHSWVARLVDGRVHGTPVDAAKAYARGGARPAVRALAGESDDLMFDRNTAVIAAPSSAELRARYGEIRFAKIAPATYLGRVRAPKDGDRWLYPDVSAGADADAVEVANAYALGGEEAGETDAEIEAEVRALLEAAGFAVARVWSSAPAAPLPYAVRRVFARVDGDTRAAAQALGAQQVRGRPLVTTVSHDAQLQV